MKKTNEIETTKIKTLKPPLVERTPRTFPAVAFELRHERAQRRALLYLVLSLNEIEKLCLRSNSTAAEGEGGDVWRRRRKINDAKRKRESVKKKIEKKRTRSKTQKISTKKTSFFFLSLSTKQTTMSAVLARSAVSPVVTARRSQQQQQRRSVAVAAWQPAISVSELESKVKKQIMIELRKEREEEEDCHS